MVRGITSQLNPRERRESAEGPERTDFLRFPEGIFPDEHGSRQLRPRVGQGPGGRDHGLDQFGQVDVRFFEIQ